MATLRITITGLLMGVFALANLFAQQDSASIFCGKKTILRDASITWVKIGWGYQRLHHQDLIFSPLIHRDGSIANGQVAVGWFKLHSHEIGLKANLFNPGPITPYTYFLQGEDATAWNHSFTFANLYYHFQFKAIPIKNGILRPGIKVDNAIWAKGYSYGRSGSFGYFASFGLKGTLSYKRRYSYWIFPNVQVELPLLAWVARSPYLANDDEFIENIQSNKGMNTFFSYVGDGSLQTWNRLQSVDVTLGNTLQFWRHRVGIHYHFLLLHHNKPLNLVHLQQGITATFTFSL